MQNSDLVSIITPAYNAARFIDETIKSVINQQHTNWEHLVVVDANSKDKTLDIVKEWSLKDPRIKLITSPLAKGAAANRNLALESAKGVYVAFIDADDLWLSDKLSKQLAFMQKHNSDFSFTGYRRVSEDGKTLGQPQTVPEIVSYDSLLRNNCIACLTAMFKREKFADIRFQEFGWEDMSFWLQILKRVPVAHGLNETLALYRIVKGSRSNNKLFAAKLRWQTYRLVEHMSLGKSLYLFFIYALSSAKKYVRF